VIASGGGSTAESFADGLLAGADGALGASSFHSGRLSIGDVKQYCRNRGLTVRP
jgi:cyclase